MAGALSRRLCLVAALCTACGRVSASAPSDAQADAVDAGDGGVDAPVDAGADVVEDSPEDAIADSPQEAGSSWVPISAVGAPSGSYGALAWTGSHLIVAGGDIGGFGQDQPTNQGAAYDPGTDTWQAIADAPRAFYRSDYVWTGSQLFVFHQQVGDWAMLYTPGLDSWRDAAPPVPVTARSRAVVVMAGTRVLLWED
jgi:hypothetical protein